MKMFSMHSINSPVIYLFVFVTSVLILTSCQTKQYAKQIPTSCAVVELTPPPKLLSQTCLYQNISQSRIANDLNRFTPNYQLWSDGADKTRWIYLPPGTQIDTSDPDRWVFPVGTQIFKEFRKPVQLPDGSTKEIRLETRHLAKIKQASNYRAWSITTYAWQQDQQEAHLLLEGANHVLGTNHNIPTRKECIICHKGNIDFILGFDAIQLSDAQAKNAFGHGPKRSDNELSLQTLLDNKLLSHPMPQPTLPGSPLEQKALGYMHANCGNCHNPSGHAAKQEAEHLKLRHKLEMTNLEETDVYRTAVNQPTKNFTIVPYIVMGAAYEEMAIHKSALFVRMNSTDEDYRMPMIASEAVDYEALELMHRWLKTIDTPPNYDFARETRASLQLDNQLQTSVPTPNMTGPGLQLFLRFSKNATPPSSMIVYWPEDKGLANQPMMDHKDGEFTEALIVGNKGALMSLRNSDEVGHTIYVKDKRQKVDWRLGYMPPNSQYSQELYWENDVFVELRCKLHLYMSAWAGSISSRFYNIVEFQENENNKLVTMTNFPESFTEVKIWMPRFKPIHTKISIGETQRFNLKRGAQIWGELIIKRSSQ